MAEEEVDVPYMELEEMVELFGYTNEDAARRHIRMGLFPVVTYRLAGRTVANTRAIQNFFDKNNELPGKE
jgi:hypothetical protein